MIVFLLTIEHKHGTDHWVFDSYAAANEQLDAYVAAWWKDVVDDSEMPASQEDRVLKYFEAAGNLSSPEFYSIEELPVLTLKEVTA